MDNAVGDHHGNSCYQRHDGHLGVDVDVDANDVAAERGVRGIDRH